jgi:co-chaperonin GroES (HSP10)
VLFIAIDFFNQKKVISPMTEEASSLPLYPCGWFLLVQEKPAINKTAGGILLAPETQDAERYLTTTGKVVAMGPDCYGSENFHGHRWCEIGDTVMFHKHAGYRIELKADEGDDPPRFRLLKDNDVFANVSDPERLRGAVI